MTPGQVVFVLGVLVVVFGVLAIAACIRSSQLSRELRSTKHQRNEWRRQYFDEADRRIQDSVTGYAGPRVTAKTLREARPDERTPGATLP